MHLTYTISPDRRTLTIRADERTRVELRELLAENPDRDNLWDAFENLICNSELGWIDPATCGDLTDAPILGVLSDERPGKGRDGDLGSGSVLVSTGRDGFTVCDVVERWGFMSYAVRDPLADLCDTGEAVFTAP
jgi:hypothetical protein